MNTTLVADAILDSNSNQYPRFHAPTSLYIYYMVTIKMVKLPHKIFICKQIMSLFLLCCLSVPRRFYQSLLVQIYFCKCGRLTYSTLPLVYFRISIRHRIELASLLYATVKMSREPWVLKWEVTDRLSHWSLGSLEDEEFSEEEILKKATVQLRYIRTKIYT